MLENETAEINGENQNQEAEAAKLAAEATAKAEAEAKAKAEAEAKSPYEAKLKELEAENEKKAEILRQKNGALKEEREANKKWEERFTALEEKLSKENPTLDKDQIEKIILEREAKKQELDEVLPLATSDDEKKLILKLMETKNLSAKDAFILANAHIVEEKRKAELSEAGDKRVMADFLGRQASGGGSKVISQIAQVAGEGLTEAEKKHLKI